MSEVRTDKLQGIWASDATTTIPESPVTGTTYRNITSDPADGSPYKTKFESAIFNQWAYTVSKLLDELQVKGTLGWNSTTAYLAGSFVYASDGNLYYGLQSSTNKDPVTETAYWKLFNQDYALKTLSNITTLAVAADNTKKEAPDVVVEYKVSTDGKSWYRKYKSGWIEQGGTGPVIAGNTTSAQTISFGIKFPSSCLNIQFSVCSDLYSYDETNGKILETGLENFKYITGAYHPSYIFWRACGF